MSLSISLSSLFPLGPFLPICHHPIRLSTFCFSAHRASACAQILDYYPDRMNIERHPVARLARNIERVEKLELNRRLGKAPPKKGQGKRATVAANKKK